jgi:hypothetical protein
MRQIIIENGVAKTVETTVIAEAPVELIGQHLVTYKPTTFPVLPDDTRVAHFDPTTQAGAVIVQRPPRLQILDVHYDVGERGMVPEDIARRKTDANGQYRDEFSVMLPYLQFAYNFRIGTPGHTWHDGTTQTFSIDKAYLYWSKDPIRSLDDKLWPAKLLNIETDGRICWGTTRADTESLSARIDHQVKSFNATTFNNHLQMRRPHGIASYDAWERQSAEDPLAYRSWTEWQQPALTVKQVLGIDPTPNNILNGEAPAAYNLPDPPRQFTVGRARQWAQELDERERRVILEAVQAELVGA